MPLNAAMFLFLAATVVAVFAFLSIAVWVTAPAQERRARERMQLLKSVAEQPGENASRVLDMLREEDRRRDKDGGRRAERIRRRRVGVGSSGCGRWHFTSADERWRRMVRRPAFRSDWMRTGRYRDVDPGGRRESSTQEAGIWPRINRMSTDPEICMS